MSALTLTSQALPEYSSRLWQSSDGLPHNAVQSIAQTRDGYLWVGTTEGLARFDGERFTVIEQSMLPGLGNRWVTALLVSADGSLWIGSEGGGLIRVKDGKVSYYGEQTGIANDNVRTLYEGKDGTIWVGTSGGLVRYRNEQWSVELTNCVVRSICEDSSGHLWLATPPNGLSCLSNGVLSHVHPYRAMSRTLRRDHQGNLWAGTEHGLLRMKDDLSTVLSPADGLADYLVGALCEDRQGQLWIGTYGGLNRLAEGAIRTELTSDGTAYDQVNALFEDREGNIWVGTKEGLHRFKARLFSPFTKQQGLTHNNVMSVLEDDAGVFWMGTWGGGLNRGKNGQFSGFGGVNPHALILSLCKGRDGSLWFGADYDGGLYRLKNEQITHYTATNGLKDAAVRVLCEDRMGNLWIGTRNALYLFKDQTFTRFTDQDGLSGSEIRAILEDSEGNLWIGTEDGLIRRKNECFANFNAAAGLSNASVLSLREDREHALWIGTSGKGLHRLRVDGCDAYTTQRGLHHDTIYEILEDDFGFLWMSCPDGIFRVSKRDLDVSREPGAGPIHSIAYGKADGLLSLQCNGVAKPAGLKSQDGRLWFPTTKGLVVVNPKIEANDAPPPVVIEEIIADRRRLAPELWKRIEDKGLIAAPPGRGELEIHYTALTFSAPEKNHFKYQLEGVDSDWVEAGSRRIAHYNNLSPGLYRFCVAVRNDSGAWNETGASVSILLHPHFWQTWWFRGLLALSTISAASGTARYLTRKKMQHKLEATERQRALEKERTRIAKDIHDDVGATLTQISLLSELTRRNATQPEQVMAYAAKVSTTANELARSMDEIVWAVNPKNDNLRQFAGYIFEYTEEVLALTRIRCRMERPMSLPEYPITAEVRHDLFLVIKEALTNTLRHSQASEVRLSLRLENSRIEIRIEDNGRGFSTATPATFGNGLANMKKRIEDIRGHFEIFSQPGKGTCISMRVPMDPEPGWH